eukprot:11973089-Alexandrium_andersonii.AAC.1
MAPGSGLGGRDGPTAPRGSVGRRPPALAAVPSKFPRPNSSRSGSTGGPSCLGRAQRWLGPSPS